MRSMVQMVPVSHNTKSPVVEREFLRLYSEWHETRDQSLQKRIFMSWSRLMRCEPAFDFREHLWRAL
jgi:hypothetical protein